MRLKGKYYWRKSMSLKERLTKNLSFHIASFKLAQQLMKIHLRTILFDEMDMNFDRFERHRKDFVMNRYFSQTECNFNLYKLQEWCQSINFVLFILTANLSLFSKYPTVLSVESFVRLVGYLCLFCIKAKREHQHICTKR